MRHLTHIVAFPFGVNILGLLEVFAFIGLMYCMISLADVVPQVLLGWSLFLIIPALSAFDVWWRYRQQDDSQWSRLFSASAGGCLLYLPIWLWFLSLFLVLIGLILVQALS